MKKEKVTKSTPKVKNENKETQETKKVTEENLAKASDFLFLFDATNCNPNGDPADENRPRMWETTNFVTDVRLKRTIRDYWDKYLNIEIFYKSSLDDNGFLNTCQNRYHDVKDRVLNLLDVKCFGATITLGTKDKNKNNNKETESQEDDEEIENSEEEEVEDKKKSKQAPVTSKKVTGAIQLMNSESLNEVEIVDIKGTGAFASGEGKIQQTFRKDFGVKYSLLANFGNINSNVAKDNNLTEEDVKLFKDALWNSVRCMTSRSKYGQSPRLFINVVYKKGTQTTLGNFYGLIKLKNKKINNITEAVVDLKKLSNLLNDNKDLIEYVEIKQDNNLTIENFDLDSSIEKRKL